VVWDTLHMDFTMHGFRHGDYLAMNVGEYVAYWSEIDDALRSISDDDIVEHFKEHGEHRQKSISITLNALIKARLVERGWAAESRIFAEQKYAEGPVAFPDPLDKPSRTILTSEGGSSPSRMKHVVRGGSGRLRRLVPDELDMLQTFPKGWTEGMSDGHRAFCMGNALVVGVPHRIGLEIAKFDK